MAGGSIVWHGLGGVGGIRVLTIHVVMYWLRGHLVVSVRLIAILLGVVILLVLWVSHANRFRGWLSDLSLEILVDTWYKILSDVVAFLARERIG